MKLSIVKLSFVYCFIVLRLMCCFGNSALKRPIVNSLINPSNPAARGASPGGGGNMCESDTAPARPGNELAMAPPGTDFAC
jgi:hypothetical protein